jgi:hypothetical protein
MNIHPVAWNKLVLIEAYKFWFYALSLSILGAVLGLLFTPRVSTASKYSSDEKPSTKKDNGKAPTTVDAQGQSQAERTALMKRIVVDGCDLLIPGAFVGWMQVSDLVVGVTMVISTVVSGGDVWGRAQI